MKEIETKESKNKKARKNRTILVIVMIGLMVLSTAGYAIMNWEGNNNSSGGKVKIGSYSFYKSQGFWGVDLNSETYYFDFLPNETSVENISLVGLDIKNYQGLPVYIVGGDYSPDKFYINLNTLLQGGFFQRINRACISEINCTDPSLPVKNCSKDNVIILQSYNNQNLTKRDNCVFIGGSNLDERNRAVDEFFYRFLSIK